MPTTDLTGTTAVVTGASRGFGRGIAVALSAAGADVIGVARTSEPLNELQKQLGERFTPVAADAADPKAIHDLITRYRPRILILNAGANPTMAPVHEQTWEAFSGNWQSDVQQVFRWTGEALRQPLAPGSVVVAMSSGAALRGSPLSGGYSGAKATVRFINAYAAEEAERASLGIRFLTILPQLTPATDLGAAGVIAYAERQGIDPGVFQQNFEPILTPELVGKTVIDLVTDSEGPSHAEFMLTGGGLRPLP